jgi:soluble lytic murein transglycosylase-like protein
MIYASVDEIEESSERVCASIKELAPRVSDQRSSNLSKYIVRYSRDTKMDPLLITAIIMRESAFSYAVQIGKKLGLPQKTVGLMQIYPFGAAHKLGRYCNLTNARCNIKTGIRWLDHVRKTCGETHWQWVAAYGMSYCPSYRRARRDIAANRARKLYCQVRSNCDEIWPRSEINRKRNYLWLQSKLWLYGYEEEYKSDP